MADRQLKIVVRTEIKKGFGELSKQIEGLSKQLNKLSGLSTSINRLADSFDKVGSGANVARKATTALNKETNSAIRIVNQYASAQDKATAKAVTLNNAVKAGTLQKTAALKAEIAILNDLIKKTGDLSVLESRRDAKGRFGYGGFSAGAVNAIKAQYAAERKAVTDGGISIVTEINNQNAKIRAAMSNLTAPGTRGLTGSARASTQSMYDNLFGAIPPTTPNNTRGYYQRGVFVQGRPPRGSGGGRGGGGGGIPSQPNLGPSHSSITSVHRLMDAYTKLGHIMFQLQMTTYTVFALSGVSLIIKQADAFIDLRNEIARTSDSLADLKPAMKDVFSIATSTFSDANSVGKIYSTINRYSQDLGLNRQQVANITRGVSGAFAASPGTADAKAAAQYQFMQAFQSGRLGGDELRSILEQAPYVGDVLAKGLARVRGQTGAVNLRDKNNPPTPSEIAQVFGDPQVIKEIMDTLANRSRTFADVVQVAKIRLLEYTGNLESGTLMFSQFNNSLAQFIAGDSFPKFISALGDAAVSASALAAVLGTRGLISAVAGSSFGRGVKGAAGGVANFATALPIYLSSNNTRKAGGMGPMIMGDLAAGASALLAPLSKLGFWFKLIGGTIGVVVTVLAALAGRFNFLLKKFGDGITIFDVIAGVWAKLTRWAQPLVDVMNSVFSGAIAWIDRLLMKLVNWAKSDTDVLAASKKVTVSGIQAALGPNLPTGQKSTVPPLANVGGGGLGKRRDPWKEFITDTALNIKQSKEMLGIPDAYRDIEDSVRDIQRRAADALDLLSFDELRKKFPSKAAAVDKLTNEMRNLKLTEKINAFYDGIVDQIMNLKLDIPIPGLTAYQSKLRSNQIDGILKFLDDPNIKLKKYTDEFGEQQDIIGKQSLRNRVKTLVGNGDLDQAQSLLSAYLEDDGYGLQKLIQDLNSIADTSEKIRQSWQVGIKNGLASVRDSFSNVAEEVSGILVNAVNNLQGAIVEWIQTGKLNWKDFFTSILADLTTLFVRQRLLRPLFEFVGGKEQSGGFVTNAITSSASKGGGWLSTAVSTIGNIFTSIFHSGGIAGQGGGGRSVPASIFANAPRYHTGGIAGLAPNEVPAILQRGERVLTIGEQRAMRGGGSVFSPTIAITYQAAPSGGQSAMSQEEHANLITQMVQNAVHQEIINYDIKSRRPGSAAYLANKFS